MTSVVVIGSGAAGLAAAVEAARAGADVTVFEKAERVGGSTAKAGGVVFAAGTHVQQAAGVEDDVDELFNYYMVITHHLLEPRLLRTSAEGTREAVTWLESMGVTWDPARLYKAGLESRPRGHLPSGDTAGLGPAGGAVIVAALFRTATEAGVTIRTGTAVEELIRDGDGPVRAVRVSVGQHVDADAVIIASGGFGASPDMCNRYWPDAVLDESWRWYLGAETNEGDGIRMGVDVGGVVIHENVGVPLETPNFGRLNDAFTPPWLVYVNLDGQRFINETDTYCVLGNSISKQPGKRCFAIFDAAALARLGSDADGLDPYGLGVDLESNWTGPMLRKQIANGTVIAADSLDQLAERTGIQADGLRAQVERWNSDAAAGRDSVFEKPPVMLLPIATSPFYAVEMRPGIVGMTLPGLRIDERARVLDRAGRPIPQLYAAGEVTAGMDGEIYAGGGTSIGSALVFGRIAGIGAAGVGPTA